MQSREQSINETLVRLADNLVSGYDPIEMFHLLVESCCSVLEVDEAGLMLKDPGGTLQVVAATSDQTHVIELFQLQNDEGPCLDAVESGQKVISGPLGDRTARERWPLFAEAALGAGIASVVALPMRLRQNILGGLNLFLRDARHQEDRDIAVAQAFADIGTITILQDRATQDARVIIDQLQNALDSRIVIEQAKGRVAQHADVDVNTGFAMLRKYSRDHNLRLSDVAAGVVEGTLPLSLL